MNVQKLQLLDQAKAVIFDMDGLLIDSEPIWAKARFDLLKSYGVENPPVTEPRTVGMGLKEAVVIYKEEYSLNQTVEDIIEAYRKIVYQLIFENMNTIVMPGALELVNTLFQKEKKLAIATGGHSVEKVEKILEALGIRKYFTVIVSCDEVTHGKPEPDVYLLSAKRLGISPEEIVVLEDAPNGILAAKKAGMIAIGVNREKHWRKKLEEAGSEEIVKSLEGLL